MEYVEYLNRGAKLVHEHVVKAGYEILENSPLCLMTKKVLALHDGNNKRIYICTGNLKSILLWNLPQSPRDKLSKTRKKETTFFMAHCSKLKGSLRENAITCLVELSKTGHTDGAFHFTREKIGNFSVKL